MRQKFPSQHQHNWRAIFFRISACCLIILFTIPHKIATRFSSRFDGRHGCSEPELLGFTYFERG